MRAREIGEVTFFCGKAGGIHVTDAHDLFADDYTQRKVREFYALNGTYPTLDQQVDWQILGREASMRRLAVEEYEAIEAATALLAKHGYTTKPPRQTRPRISCESRGVVQGDGQ